MRITIFFLRLALGIDFFYLGFCALFNQALGRELSSRSIGDLYFLLISPTNAGWLQTFSEWAFLLAGICLIVGLATRVASIGAFILIFAQYLQGIITSAVSPERFVSDEVLVMVCLLILVVSGAGTYLGFDRFIHGRAPTRE
jgi:uncharacterized membrane protein YphA (DoxX/SURF4 family)